MGCQSLLQGIFPTQGLNLRLLCLLNWQAGSLPLVLPGKPFYFAKLKQFFKTNIIIWFNKRTIDKIEYQNKEKPFKWKKWSFRKNLLHFSFPLPSSPLAPVAKACQILEQEWLGGPGFGHQSPFSSWIFLKPSLETCFSNSWSLVSGRPWFKSCLVIYWLCTDFCKSLTFSEPQFPYL